MNEIIRGGPKSYRRKMIVRAYSALGDSYHEFALKESSRPWWELFRNRMRAGGMVLDLGCGSGVFARYLLDSWMYVLGIDISPEMVVRASHYAPGAEFRVGAMETIVLPKGYFEGIAAFFSCLHLPKVKTAMVIAKCYEWLLPGGTLAIAIVEGEGEGICENFMQEKVPIYLSYYQSEEMRELLLYAGFEITDVRNLRVQAEGFDETELFFLARKPQK